MIPLINYLLQFQCQVFIATGEQQRKLLEQEFPHLQYLTPPDYDVKYNSAGGHLVFGLFRQIPRLIRVIHHERKWVADIVKNYKIDAIISDNRYGFYHKDIYSVFITHQIRPKSGISTWIDNILKNIHVRWIRRFNECWVPDSPGSILSGELSLNGRLPAGFHFMGPLSRFAGTLHKPGSAVGILALVSGPEPQRTYFERELQDFLEHTPSSYLIVRGLPGSGLTPIPHSVTHLPAEALEASLQGAEKVICRSGYTSIMDLVALGKTAILVPTPGQTEQEYLASYLAGKQYFLQAGTQKLTADLVRQMNGFVHQLPELDFFRFRVFLEQLLLRIKNSD